LVCRHIHHLNGLQPPEKLSVFEQVGVETGGLTEVAVNIARRDHRRWRTGRAREKQRELVHEVPGSLGATIPGAINSQGKPFTLQPKCAHKELKFFGFGGEVTMFRMGEDEIQAHQLDLHRVRPSPAAIAVIFLAHGVKQGLGSDVIDERTISGFVDADMALNDGLFDKAVGSTVRAVLKELGLEIQ
jgi:hypothetical protein